MPSTAERFRTPRQTEAGDYELKVSVYERFSGLLIALLVLIGSAVAALFVVWLTNRIFARPLPVPVVMENIGSGGEGSGIGGSLEFAEAAAGELAQELGAAQPTTESVLSLLDDTIAEHQAELNSAAASNSNRSAAGGGGGGQSQGGSGQGGGLPGIPRGQRWEVHFDEGIRLDTYARQLDFLGIELGVVGAGPKVIYVSKLSSPSPRVRTGIGSAEKRLFMSWRHGGLEQADRDLLKRAGVEATANRILHFYPPEVENRMALAEKKFAGREPTEIRRTRFGVRQAGDRYEMYVLDQTAF